LPDLVVAGAGMAGLAAAAHARSRGADVLVLEKGDRPGGAMLLSSGVIWRHREWETFTAEAPDGDRALQRLVFDRLDDALRWVEQLGARVVDRETGNPRTRGVRFDTASLTATLAGAGGGVRCGEPLRALPGDGTPVVLATGGFAADHDLVAEHITREPLLLRTTPWSTGDGLRLGLDAGGTASSGLGEFYGRNMPAPPARWGERDFVALSQLYARHATVTNARGAGFAARTWSEIDVVQWTARQPGARAFYRVTEAALEERVRERSVRDMVEAAAAAGAPVVRGDGAVTVETAAAITTTLGGLRIDERARVAPGVWAAGADAGGVATGGYASGLAAALVLGRVAADAALEER
jgi:succinate dehydrogenase/fumarate reductase flavoprotein subunit